jgi:hypothetical protein
MTRPRLHQAIPPLLAALATVAALPASAAILAFTGTEMNDTPTPGPSPLCGIGQVRVAFSPSTATTSGTSNLGSFGPTMAHCLTPPPTSYSGGVFDFDFGAGDDLLGTYSGHFTPTGTANLLNTFVEYVVTGGTGRFLDASGTIHGVGILDRRVARPINSLTLNGVLNLPGVPEPATWTMMILGFGLVGLARRARNSKTGNPVFAPFPL